jgi:hypothetical protein
MASPPVHADRRLHHQQQRIHQGIKTGQLTRGEARRLEWREHRIHREVRWERGHNGGYLHNRERRHVRRQLNRTSGAIWRNKHNGRVRH